MAQAVIFTMTGSKKETPAKLDNKVFAVEPNHELIAQAYRAYLAAGRTAGAKVLTRGEVRGGGKKPWRQKGTGRARAGSSRIPHWKGGGVVFGPTGNENYEIKLTTKSKRAAIRGALSLQATEKKIIFIEDFDGGEGKVKPVTGLLGKLGVDGRVLLVVDAKNDAIDRSTRNISGIKVVSAKYLSVFDIMNADWIVMTTAANDIILAWLAGTEKKEASSV
jgi:large subunit ribosomal protein L4